MAKEEGMSKLEKSSGASLNLGNASSTVALDIHKKYQEVLHNQSNLGTGDDQTGKYRLCYHQILVNTSERYREHNMVDEILHTHAGMSRMNFKLREHPHFVDTAYLDSKTNEQLMRAGIHVNDRTNMTPFFKSIYHPEYNLKAARLRGKRVTGMDGVPSVIQQRKDGWATYFKFLAWKMSQ